MAFWWVNHKQTFRHEFDGGYIWSPKRKRDGGSNPFYDFMRMVRPGDVIFSYAFGVVQGAGVAVSHCYTCPRPNEFGRVGGVWDMIGWRVDVEFSKFANKLRPKDHIERLRIYLPEMYSPIRSATGDGNQGVYLTAISSALADFLAGLIGYEAVGILGLRVQYAERRLFEMELKGVAEWEEQELHKLAVSGIEETVRQALVKARIGQGLFKRRVAACENHCRITKVENAAHLVASHIKPWRESSNEERLAPGNGLLLTPTIDHLFDRGFISFDDSGETLIAPVADRVSLGRMGVDSEHPPLVGEFNSDQRHFLEYHRANIFLARSA